MSDLRCNTQTELDRADVHRMHWATASVIAAMIIQKKRLWTLFESYLLRPYLIQQISLAWSAAKTLDYNPSCG
jgi:hypothetical protein